MFVRCPHRLMSVRELPNRFLWNFVSIRNVDGYYEYLQKAWKIFIFDHFFEFFNLVSGLEKSRIIEKNTVFLSFLCHYRYRSVSVPFEYLALPLLNVTHRCSSFLTVTNRYSPFAFNVSGTVTVTVTVLTIIFKFF